MKNLILFTLFAFSFSISTQANTIGYCTKSDPSISNYETFAVMLEGSSAKLGYQKTVNRQIVENHVLASDFLCEKQQMNGRDSLVCFSKRTTDKLFIGSEDGFYEFTLWIMSPELKANVAKASIESQIAKGIRIVNRQYGLTSDDGCRFP